MVRLLLKRIEKLKLNCKRGDINLNNIIIFAIPKHYSL